jgi:hypothetical protein
MAVDINDIWSNPLKKMSMEELQETIASAITSATGKKHEANVSRIEYGNLSGAKLEIELWVKSDLSWLNTQPEHHGPQRSSDDPKSSIS